MARWFVFAPVFLMLSACSLTGFGSGWPPDGRFDESEYQEAELSPGVFIYNTVDEIYVSFDGGKDWKCIFVIPENDRISGKDWPVLTFGLQGGCIGGSSSNLIISLGDQSSNSSTMMGYTLVEWTPSGKVTRLCDLPAYTQCQFASPAVGAYAYDNRIYFTVDEAHSWREINYVKLSRDNKEEQPADKVFSGFMWVSPTELLIASGSAVSLVEISAEGNTKELWRKDVSDCRGFRVLNDGDVYVETINNIVQMKVADGSVIQKLHKRDIPATYAITPKGHFYVFGGNQVIKYKFDEKGPTRVSALTVPTEEITAVFPIDENDALIMTYDHEKNAFEWDGKSMQAKALPSRIDNSAIREANKPGPDEATYADISEFATWASVSNDETRGEITEAAFDQKDWSGRQRVLWSTEQLKKAAANLGHWTRPATMPAADPAMTANKHDDRRLGYSVGL